MGVCRTSGGDKVEAFLCGPGDAVLPVAVKDLNNGCYVLSSTADKPGTWTIKPRVGNTSEFSTEGCQGGWLMSIPCKTAGGPMGRAVTVTGCCLYPCAMASGMRHADLASPQVNGEALESAQRQLAASYGPVTAADCVLTWAGGATLDTGASQKLIVQPKHLQHGRLRVMHLSLQFTTSMAGDKLSV